MYKNVPHKALKAAYSEFLVTKIQNNDMQSVTEWVEESLVNENPNIDDVRKIAFYEAEKSLIKLYIAENNFEKLNTLINAIDNKKFKDDPKHQKLKVNECRVLAGAIIEAKKYLEEDKSIHKDLCKLLDTKYQELTDESYKNKISEIIGEALSIISYTPSEIVTTMGGDGASGSMADI
ncbi:MULTISPECIES: hypothetical protein [Rickettsieae]|uniref:hypothetical protein n=1 Tax=Rickettsieae TaxID=33988 RepID=UPI000B9C2ABE|nr:hypothetical protein [Rickettsia endosymbiont of Culicoides newsteadi]OZG31520.1 hypothetical protein RiCNE_10900 [Rickettsia endosymbiont of Culicoides newsteadi]